jgi:hypothetical protein
VSRVITANNRQVCGRNSGRNRRTGPHVQDGVDDEDAQALRAEGFDPDDPAVIERSTLSDGNCRYSPLGLRSFYSPARRRSSSARARAAMARASASATAASCNICSVCFGREAGLTGLVAFAATTGTCSLHRQHEYWVSLWGISLCAPHRGQANRWRPGAIGRGGGAKYSGSLGDATAAGPMPAGPSRKRVSQKNVIASVCWSQK